MTIYFTDDVQITPVTRDASFRNETPGTAFTSTAYVEMDDKIIYDNTGMPIKAARKIFLPYDTVIKEGDYIKITKKNGITYSDVNHIVRSVDPIGSFGKSHLEVIS